MDALVVAGQVDLGRLPIAVELAPDKTRLVPSAGQTMQLAGASWCVAPTLVRGKFRLECGDAQVCVGEDHHGWTVEVTWRAIYLMTHSVTETIARTLTIMAGLSTGAVVRATRIRRLDLAADLEHCVFTDVDAAANFVGLSQKRSSFDPTSYGPRVGGTETFRNGAPAVTGIGIGRGGRCYVRLYDKTRELRDMHGDEDEKTRTERAIWSRGGWTGGAVWRVEAQLRREVLDELRVRAVEDLTPTALAEVWAYVTQKWLRLIDATTATRRKRARLDPRWHAVQCAWSGDDVPDEPATREHGDGPGADVATAMGTLLSTLRARRRLPALPDSDPLTTLRLVLDAFGQIVQLDTRVLDALPGRVEQQRAKSARV